MEVDQIKYGKVQFLQNASCSRQKINEIVANKRTYFGPFAQAENMDELISTPHEAEMGYEEPKLLDPNDNNLTKFEVDLMVFKGVKLT